MLTHSYDLPRVTFRPRRWVGAVPFVAIVVGSVALHGAVLHQVSSRFWAIGAWLLALAFMLTQMLLSWTQRPLTATAEEEAELSLLSVAVIIPCYNEDPAIVDRTLYSVFTQSRLPEHVLLTDDGSSVSYDEVRDYWEEHRPPQCHFTWIRQENRGKKHAQAAAIARCPDADIIATIDSDSALEHYALEEGLKPFTDPGVASVAGLETAINWRRNLLTRMLAVRSLTFQLFAMSAQSQASGNVLINPGAFSLYRGPLIRSVMPCYLGETFFGIPVRLGDDTALTLFALLHGKAVHQPTAVSLPVYPETLDHHLREWTRWMRASTIRMFWRFRYLRVRSYAWLYTLWMLWSYLASVALSIVAVAGWPATSWLVKASAAALVIWPLAVASRLVTVHRSDQSLPQALISAAVLPLAALWYVLVLRQMRLYGMATCHRQGWVTRKKVEVALIIPQEELV